MKYISILTLLMIAMAACSTTEKTVEESMEDIKNGFDDEISRSGIQLQTYRTELSDSYSYRENIIPEGFNRVKVQQEEQKDLYEGYRIQIFSGPDVNGADTTAASFRAWADTTIAGYQPETYVFFRTPHYRVHVGDFHEREKAIQFSNIVKRYFKDAWVVYDRVVPENVPADTTKIEIK